MWADAAGTKKTRWRNRIWRSKACCPRVERSTLAVRPAQAVAGGCQRNIVCATASISDDLDALSHEIDWSPFQLPDEMSFFKIHYLFAMLGLHVAFVTTEGRLVGVITKKEFLKRAAARMITI